jgi:drug/metabolite transporter (DMT)-like permease
MDKPMNTADWALLAATAGLLGSSFLLLNIAVSEIPPMVVAAARAIIAIPICWLVMRRLGVWLPATPGGWMPLIWLGLLTAAIPFATIAWGQQHIDSGLGGILFGSLPVMMVLLAPAFLADERLTGRRIAGAMIGLAGVVLVIGPAVLANAGEQIEGVLITLAAVGSYAAGTIYARRQTQLAPPTLATGQMIIGAALLLPLAIGTGPDFTETPSLGAIAAVGFVGVFSTAIAMSLFFVLIRRVGAGRTSLVPLFMPVVAVGLGALALGETLAIEALAGLALILTGALAVNSTSAIKRTSRPSSQLQPKRS